MSKYAIYILVVFLFSCRRIQNQQEFSKSNTIILNSNSKIFLEKDIINLPLGLSDIIIKKSNSDSIIKIFDKPNLGIDKFKNLFRIDNNILSYNSLSFKEDYYDRFNLSTFNNDEKINILISSGFLKYKNYNLFFALDSKNERDITIFLLSVNNNKILDSKKIFYHREREMGYTYGRRFYINSELIISTRDYAFTEEGINQMPFFQYQLNSEGKFIRYYDKNGNFKNEEEQGTVKNHTREGKWIEILDNYYTGNNYTYLEAEYKGGLPVGKFKYYNLEQEYNDNGEPILSTRKKGKLLYTETYENGELKERKFVK